MILCHRRNWLLVTGRSVVPLAGLLVAYVLMYEHSFLKKYLLQNLLFSIIIDRYLKIWIL